MREIDRLHLILLNIGSSVHNGDWNWQGISSPFARLFYVKEGSAKLHLSGSTQELRQDHLYLIPPFTLHSYECEAHFSHCYIHIYEKPSSGGNVLEDFNFPVEIKADVIDWLLVDRLQGVNPGRELVQFDPKKYDNAPTLLRNIAEEAHQPSYALLETKGILLQLLSRFIRLATPKADVFDLRIQKVLSYIRKNIDKQINISQLSELSHLSEDHFIRLFKKETNSTPIDYINRKKIEKAQLMLLVDNSSVKDIAYSLSFENISYFNRLFKKITHYTPTQYRNLLHGG